MTKIQFFRKWIGFLTRAQKWTDIIGILSVLILFASQMPIEIWNSNPATGGDTASHFWPLVTLVQEGLPNWHVRVWNPGNLGGEPHLTHYFPLPYLLMAFFSLFMPLGRAFNIGTLLPVFFLPVSIYFCFRGMKTRFPLPLLAMLASLSFLYNESFSMWGGNFLSTLAGQFAHVYAYNFLFLGIGSLYWEMNRRKFPWMAMLLFACVCLSHFYVALFLPLVFLCFLVFDSNFSFQERLSKLFLTGVGSVLLSAWFVIPMVHNAQWNTAFGVVWGGEGFFQEAFPKIFWPFAFFSLLLMLIFGLRKNKTEKDWRLTIPLLLSFLVYGIILYFIFPKLGLVDIRVLPTLQLVVCLLAATLISVLFNRYLPKPWLWFWILPLSLVLIWWAGRDIYKLPYWLKWNYSGWEAKTAYPDLKRLTEDLKGNFSQGRVIYENNELSNAAGTIRVFEMLPYFSGRATMESLYMQSTILAPQAFYLQALISKTPSCPFPNFECTTYEVQRLRNYLRLMGISDLILITPEVREQADPSEFLTKMGEYGNWTHYKSNLPSPLVETLHEIPEFIEKKDFKRDFYNWFLTYSPEKPFLVIAPEKMQEPIRQTIATEKECHPSVDVDFDQIVLQTDCPGQFHYLKFAFHSTWKASSGDELYLMSPGFIGLIPSQTTVTLRWGHHWLWTFSNFLSWIALLVLLPLYIWQRKRVSK